MTAHCPEPDCGRFASVDDGRHMTIYQCKKHGIITVRHDSLAARLLEHHQQRGEA